MDSESSNMGFSGKIFGALAVVGLVFLGACESIVPEDIEVDEHQDPIDVDYSKRKTIFGEGGFDFFGEDRPNNDGSALGVNSFLWRASLDTISFMPVNSADPFGGVIITDWHTAANAPNERFKLNVYILGRALRADGIRVSVFRQVQVGGGAWRDANVPQATPTKIEDAILTRARQIRNATLDQE